VGEGEGKCAGSSRRLGKRVADVFAGDTQLDDLDAGERLDYYIVIGLAHGLSYDEVRATPMYYLRLLDVYDLTRGNRL